MTRAVIGRDSELAAIDDMVDRVVGGNGGLVFLHGPPGIGKSCLSDALAGSACERDLTVRHATAIATRGGQPFSLFTAFVPEGDLDSGDPDAEVVLRAVEAMDDGSPSVLVIEDAHWADRYSVSALGVLGRRAVDLGLLLAVTARDLPARGDLAVLSDLATAHGYDLPLRELGADEVLELAHARLGQTLGIELVQLCGSIGGNPFLVHELLDAIEHRAFQLPRECVAEPGELDLRRRMRDVAVDSIPMGSVIVPALAALPGGASARELAAILDAPFGPIVDALLKGIDAGTLVGGPTSVSFRHDLVRQAVLATTSTGVEHDLIRRAVDVLGSVDADADRQAACLLELATYADPADGPTLVAAGRSHLHDRPDLAADLYAEAVALAYRANSVDETVLYEFGSALLHSGRAAEVEPLLDRHFEPFHLDEPIARQRLRGNAALLVGKLDILVDNYQSLTVDEIERRYSNSDSEAVIAVAELAVLRANAGRPADASELLAWVARSPCPTNPSLERTIHETRSLLAVLDGRFDEAVALAGAALRHAHTDVVRPANEVTPRLMRAIALGHLGDDEGSLATVRAPLRGQRPLWAAPMFQGFATAALYRLGRWDDALAEADAAIAGAAEWAVATGSEWPHAVAAIVSIARGDLDAASGWIAAGDRPDATRGVGREWMALAVVHLLEAQGNDAAAGQVAAMASQRILDAPAPGLLLNAGADLVRVCLADGKTDQAAAIADTLKALADRSTSAVAAGAARWAVGLCRNEAGLIADGASMLSAVHRRPEAARAFADAAQTSASMSTEMDTREYAETALGLFEAIGAPQWADRLQSTLRAAGFKIGASRPPVRTALGWDGLTDSEARIVQMLGNGHTNGEIAAQLVISRRTVESHLVHVYQKLGFTSRAQLVAAAARR
jgi:DNA-binding CsgD family transcriptional regulator/tetratricopeptide (TPR) repeat protein